MYFQRILNCTLHNSNLTGFCFSSSSEIDKSLDQMANMRKDKIIMEGKLKKYVFFHPKTVTP